MLDEILKPKNKVVFDNEFLCSSKPRQRLQKYPFQSKRHVHIQFLELDTSTLGRDGLGKDLQDKDNGNGSSLTMSKSECSCIF